MAEKGDLGWRLVAGAAAFGAGFVARKAITIGWKKATGLHVPWCTYTSPEVAHVGLYAEEAEARGHAVDTITVPMADMDRAVQMDPDVAKAFADDVAGN